MNRRVIENLAIKKYGETRQIVKAIEEMGELTQALSKWLYRPTEENRQRVREELGDVTIVTEELHLIFGDTGYWERKKLNRLLRRMEEDKHE